MLRLQRVEGNCYDPSLHPEKVLRKPTVTHLGRSNEHSDVVINSQCRSVGRGRGGPGPPNNLANSKKYILNTRVEQ